MKRMRVHGRWMTAIACIAMVVPRMGWSADELRRLPAPAVSVQAADVKLDAAQRLRGQLVDPQGRPQASVEVSLWQRDKLLARTRTQADGRFAFRDLPGGVYQLLAADTAATYQVWPGPTAPANTPAEVLLVDAGVTLRGQEAGYVLAPDCACTAPAVTGSGHYDGAVRRTLTSPWVVGGLIAAGIAIPLALSDNADSH